MHIEDRWVRKDKTRKPEYGSGKRWRVVYEDGGKRRRQSFDTKGEAQAFMTATDHAQRSGQYVSRERREELVGVLLPDWEASLIRLKPSTRQEVRYTIAGELEPHWGTRQVGSVTRGLVQEWVNDMFAQGRAARTVSTIYGRFHAFMTWAALEGYIPANPCQDIVMPRGNSREHIILSPDEVTRLLAATPEHYRLLVETLVKTGMRIGEAAELRVKDLDLPRRRVRINRAVARGVVGSPKSHKRREVPLTTALAAALDRATAGRSREDLVFPTVRGQQIRANNFKTTVFDPAVQAAGLPEGLRVHDLRHTCASQVISAGGSVKLLQRMLGHASAQMTLDVYSGLLEKDLDSISDRLDGVFGDAADEPV